MRSWLKSKFVSSLPLDYPRPSELVLPNADADGRFVSLEGGFNFRDIGGYQTQDGRFVRHNLVYRSGTLHHLTPKDHETLLNLNLRLSCDLRSVDEADHRPDTLPDGIGYLPLHMSGGHERFGRLRGLRTVLFARHELEGLMLKGYTKIILEENTTVLADAFRLVADTDCLPLVFHCSAGKDRTGVFVALLLSYLGVPDDTILADYSLSNLAYADIAAIVEPTVRRLFRIGISLDELRPVMVAPPDRLQTTFATLRQRYGSVENYLQTRLNLDEEILSRLRKNLLEPTIRHP